MVAGIRSAQVDRMEAKKDIVSALEPSLLNRCLTPEGSPSLFEHRCKFLVNLGRRREKLPFLPCVAAKCTFLVSREGKLV